MTKAIRVPQETHQRLTEIQAEIEPMLPPGGGYSLGALIAEIVSFNDSSFVDLIRERYQARDTG